MSIDDIVLCTGMGMESVVKNNLEPPKQQTSSTAALTSSRQQKLIEGVGEKTSESNRRLSKKLNNSYSVLSSLIIIYKAREFELIVIL